jgi:hypothetical protein
VCFSTSHTFGSLRTTLCECPSPWLCSGRPSPSATYFLPAVLHILDIVAGLSKLPQVGYLVSVEREESNSNIL